MIAAALVSRDIFDRYAAVVQVPFQFCEDILPNGMRANGQAAPPNTVSAADLNKPPQAPGVPGVGSGQGASPAVPAIATGRPDVAAASVPSVAGAAPPGPR